MKTSAVVVRSSLVFFAAGLAATDLNAQRSQNRSGFWFSLGSGFGSVASTCSGCRVADLTGTDQTGYIRLGGTLNRHVLLGAEFGDWVSSEAGVEQSRDADLVSLYVYPWADQGLFIKGGMGHTRFQSEDGLRGDGWAVASGIGYDLRIFDNISVTSEANFWFGSVGRLKDRRDVTMARDYTQSVFDVRLGLTVH